MLYLINPFAGKIGRVEWWWMQAATIVLTSIFMTALILIDFDLSFLTGNEQPTNPTPIYLGAAFLLYLNFSTCLNRLRDTKRPWWFFMVFWIIPFIGMPAMVYFCGFEAGKKDLYDIGDPEVFGRVSIANTSHSAQFFRA